MPTPSPDTPAADAHIAPLDPDSPILDHDGHPYLRRVEEMVRAWVQEEWHALTRLRAAAAAHHWTAARLDAALAEARLTPHNLARRLDNISLSKLRRELRKHHVPPPGEIIRVARLTLAAHLLLNTRLLVREVGERAGYESEKHFTDIFHQTQGVSPSGYRRRFDGAFRKPVDK